MHYGTAEPVPYKDISVASLFRVYGFEFLGCIETDRLKPVLRANFGEDRAAGKQAAESEQKQARLAQGDVPENARGFVAGVLAQRAARRIVHEIDEAAVIRLLELMNRLANEQVEIELPSQRTQFAAFSAIHDGFANADSPAKPGDDPADRRNFHLSGGIADQEHSASAHAAFDGSPTVVYRDS